LDENEMMVQGVKQDVLETAIPKRGGAILVVQGKHRGVLGKLMERDSDKGIGVVQKEDTYEMLTLSLDHIAEFVGDPNELGY
jgi:G patch domain/KOW motif-containing protein